MVDKHQWLTVVYALLTVEVGERYDGLATCEPPGGGALGETPMCHHIADEFPRQNSASTGWRESRRV